ncbi:MAG: TRAM domain-containing protein [Spirochaetota bacterium]
MSHLYKIGVSLFTSLLSFVLLFFKSNNAIDPIVYSSIVFILVLAIVYGETKLFPQINPERVFCIAIGGTLGLLFAFLLTFPIHSPDARGIIVLLHIVLAFLGMKVGLSFSEKPGLAAFYSNNDPEISVMPNKESSTKNKEKILDTSVVIDGRILDIADTHFIDGPLILPNFVLREIQLISDSSDPIKRARGRRGLDMLNKLQRKGSIEVKITYTDYTDTREVDAKLIKLSMDTGAKLVTNDFNLNKVAELQGVEVLNLNNLANALKPVVLPGEELAIQVIKEGKDENQGIGYMEDGTMVVIENGGHLVGKEVRVGVTSIIQTAAGKMIFTKVVKS